MLLTARSDAATVDVLDESENAALDVTSSSAPEEVVRNICTEACWKTPDEPICETLAVAAGEVTRYDKRAMRADDTETIVKVYVAVMPEGASALVSVKRILAEPDFPAIGVTRMTPSVRT